MLSGDEEKKLKPKNPLLAKMQQNQAFRSPTDNLFSPATQKVEAKRKHLMNNIKPTSLSDRFKDNSQ